MDQMGGLAKQLDYASAEATPSAISSRGKEIKLWDRSVIPLGGTSVTHDAFRAPPPQPPQPSSRAVYTPNPHRLDSRTTTADAYQAWPIDQPSPPQPVQPIVSPHRFEATSVTHDAFRAPPPQPRQTPSRAVYTPNPHRLDSRTTTADAYQAIAVPRGVQALGVETQGGGFHTLIAAGSVPPARGSAVFTTTHDGQTAVVIKALAVYAGEPFELGAFELGGIAPQPTGVPQVGRPRIARTRSMHARERASARAHTRRARARATQASIAAPPRRCAERWRLLALRFVLTRAGARLV
jgi:hypothetical protein